MLISTLEAQNEKLSQHDEPKFLVKPINNAVANNLNITLSDKPSILSSHYSYTCKPYLGKPDPSILAPGMDCSLDP